MDGPRIKSLVDVLDLVLENLPHDLVYSPNPASPWTEVWLERMPDSLQVFEVYKPIQDKLIAECIKIIGMDKDLTSGSILTSTVKSMWSKAFPRPQRAWIPTSCLQLLEALHWALPKMSLIASDFSYLPNIKIAGDRAPLVSTKKDGKTVDHSCYLDAKIYEIGGGSGNCAKYIMDYILETHPKVYNSMSYISVEISPSLADTQLKTIGGQNKDHSSRFSVECRDASDRKGWGDVEPGPCWVIMLQVLENLPHDLVYSPNLASPWTEVWLERMPDSLQVFEVYKPIQDKLIAECIKIIGMDKDLTSGSILTSTVKSMWSKAFPRPQRAWIPTGCLQLLEALHWALPKMSLIASDFSYLPNIKIAGDRAPLVSTKKDGKTVDHSCYLDAKGDADIFFPTDFWLLERMDHHCSGCSHGMAGSVSLKPEKQRRTITLDTAAFMKEFGLPSRTRTIDGYNPLLDEFQNTKFYLSVPTHNF